MIIYNNMDEETEKKFESDSNKDPFDLVMESINTESTIDDMIDKLEIQYEKGIVDDITYQEQKEALNARRLNEDNNKNYKESVDEPEEDPNNNSDTTKNLLKAEESEGDLKQATKESANPIKDAFNEINSIISEKMIEELPNLPESLLQYSESSKTGSELLGGIEVDYALGNINEEECISLLRDIEEYIKESLKEEFSIGTMLPQCGSTEGVGDYKKVDEELGIEDCAIDPEFEDIISEEDEDKVLVKKIATESVDNFNKLMNFDLSLLTESDEGYNEANKVISELSAVVKPFEEATNEDKKVFISKACELIRENLYTESLTDKIKDYSIPVNIIVNTVKKDFNNMVRGKEPSSYIKVDYNTTFEGCNKLLGTIGNSLITEKKNILQEEKEYNETIGDILVGEAVLEFIKDPEVSYNEFTEGAVKELITKVKTNNIIPDAIKKKIAKKEILKAKLKALKKNKYAKNNTLSTKKELISIAKDIEKAKKDLEIPSKDIDEYGKDIEKVIALQESTASQYKRNISEMKTVEEMKEMKESLENEMTIAQENADNETIEFDKDLLRYLNKTIATTESYTIESVNPIAAMSAIIGLAWTAVAVTGIKVVTDFVRAKKTVKAFAKENSDYHRVSKLKKKVYTVKPYTLEKDKEITGNAFTKWLKSGTKNKTVTVYSYNNEDVFSLACETNKIIGANSLTTITKYYFAPMSANGKKYANMYKSDVLLSKKVWNQDIKKYLKSVAEKLKVEVSEEDVKESAEEFKEVEELALLIEAANIDSEIKPIIDKLNRKGYKTKYSSAGHEHLRKKVDKDRDGVYYGKGYSDARIMFDADYKFPKAPRYWKWRKVDGKDYLDVVPLVYSKKNADDAFDDWKNKYLASLSEWVDNLPERGDVEGKDASEHTKTVNPDKEVKESVDESYDNLFESLMFEYGMETEE